MLVLGQEIGNAIFWLLVMLPPYMVARQLEGKRRSCKHHSMPANPSFACAYKARRLRRSFHPCISVLRPGLESRT